LVGGSGGVLRLRFAEAVPEGVPRSGKAGAKRRRSTGSSLFNFSIFIVLAVMHSQRCHTAGSPRRNDRPRSAWSRFGDGRSPGK